MGDLPTLARRLAKVVENGRGVRFEAADVDLLVEIGVYDVVQAKAAEVLKERAKCRDVQRRRASISVAPTGSIGIDGQTEASEAPSSRSSGTTPNADATAAFQRAQEMLSRPSPRLTATI